MDISKLTYDEIRDLFRNDVDSYGRPKKLMTKVNALIDMIIEAEEKAWKYDSLNK